MDSFFVYRSEKNGNRSDETGRRSGGVMALQIGGTKQKHDKGLLQL